MSPQADWFSSNKPGPPTDYGAIITDLAKQHGIAPELALAVAKKESNMNPDARGALDEIGLFQLRPSTARMLNVDINDPQQNIAGGIRYLKQLSDKYDGDLTKTLMAYNGGPDNVDKGTSSQAAKDYAAEVLKNVGTSSPGGNWFDINKAPDSAKPKTPTPPPIGQTHLKVAPGVFWRILRPSAPILGAMLGAAKGTAMGVEAGPPGMFFGAVAGGMTGAMGFETLEMALETIGRKMGIGAGLEPLTSVGATSRLTSAGATAVVGEAMGPPVNALAKAALSPFKLSLQPYAKEALETFQKTRGGSAVLPAEVSRSGVLGFAQNVAEGGIGSRATVEAVQDARQAMAERKVIDVLDRLGPSTTPAKAGARIQKALPAGALERAEAATGGTVDALERQATAAAQAGAGTARELVQGVGPVVSTKTAGTSVQASRTAAVRVFREQERRTWKLFEESARDIPLETPRLDAFIAGLSDRERAAILPNAGESAARRVQALTAVPVEDAAGTLPIGGRQLNPATMNPGARAALEQAGVIDGEVVEAPITAGQFQKTVSNLKTMARALERSAKMDPSKYNQQLGLTKKLVGLAEADLEASLKGSPALDAYHEATALSRVGNERLFNAEVRRMANESPSKVTDQLLRPNNSKAIQLVRDAAGPEAMQGVQSVALQKLTRPDPATGQIKWSRVLTEIQRLGPDTLDSLFPNGEVDGLKRLAQGITEAQQRFKGAMDVQALATSSAREAAALDPLTSVRGAKQTEKIPGLLFRRDNVTAITAVRDAVGPEAFAPIQRVAMEEVLHPDPVTGKIQWGDVLTRLDKLDPDSLKAFYPGGHAEDVKRIARLMVNLDRKHVGGAGRVGIMLTQFGAVAGAATGTLPMSAAAILLGPSALARIMASPTGLKWLTTGLSAPAGSRAAVDAGRQVAAFLSRDLMQYQKEQAPSNAPADIALPAAK